MFRQSARQRAGEEGAGEGKGKHTFGHDTYPIRLFAYVIQEETLDVVLEWLVRPKRIRKDAKELETQYDRVAESKLSPSLQNEQRLTGLDSW